MVNALTSRMCRCRAVSDRPPQSLPCAPSVGLPARFSPANSITQNQEISDGQSVAEEKSAHEHVAQRRQFGRRLLARTSCRSGQTPGSKRDDEGRERPCRSLVRWGHSAGNEEPEAQAALTHGAHLTGTCSQNHSFSTPRLRKRCTHLASSCDGSTLSNNKECRTQGCTGLMKL